MNKTTGKAVELWWRMFEYLSKHPRPWWITIMVGLLALYGAGTYWWLIKLDQGWGFSWESGVEIVFCVSYIYFCWIVVKGKVAVLARSDWILWGCPIIFQVVSSLACSIAILVVDMTFHGFPLPTSDWRLAVMVIGFYTVLGIVLEAITRFYSWIKQLPKGESRPPIQR